MEFIVYRSRALVAPGSAEAMAILRQSVRNNTKCGLTGFLHHEPGLFVQYLEGPARSLRRLWLVLGADARHAEPTQIGSGTIAHRLFDVWRMGYSNGDVANFLEFLEEATGKSLLAEASARETIWFLRGACQRMDLGLAS